MRSRLPLRSRRPPETRGMLCSRTTDLVIRFSKELTQLNDPRYVIVNKATNQIRRQRPGRWISQRRQSKELLQSKAGLVQQDKQISRYQISKWWEVCPHHGVRTLYAHHCRERSHVQTTISSLPCDHSAAIKTQA